MRTYRKRLGFRSQGPDRVPCSRGVHERFERAGGVDRVISVRRAAPDDSATVFAWRNDEATRIASVSHDVVEWADHETWYDAALADPQRYLYLALEGDDRAGLVRFDVAPEGSAEVSINLNPDFRGRGLARPILAAAIDAFRGEGAGALELTATIRPENVASIKTFESMGFVSSGSGEQLEHYVLASV